MLQHFETVYFHTSAPSADHHAKTPLGNAFRCFRILPFPIQVNAMFFEFLGIAHKKSPFTNCPVKGVHINEDKPLSSSSMDIGVRGNSREKWNVSL